MNFLCDFIMTFLANLHFILQISHVKTFKMKYTRGPYNNIIQKYSWSHKDRLCGSNFYESDVSEGVLSKMSPMGWVGGQKWAKFGQHSFSTTPKKKEEEEEAEATTSAVRHQKTALGVILRPKNNRT